MQEGLSDAQHVVFSSPKAFIKIGGDVCGYVRNLSFSENIQRANVQGLGSLILKEAPAVLYTCQWSVSQYFLSFDAAGVKKMLRKEVKTTEMIQTLIMGELKFDIEVFTKTVSSKNGALVSDLGTDGIITLADCVVNTSNFQIAEGGIAGIDVSGIYFNPVSMAKANGV